MTMSKYATEDDLENQKWECEWCHQMFAKDKLMIHGDLEVCGKCENELLDIADDHIRADYPNGEEENESDEDDSE